MVGLVEPLDTPSVRVVQAWSRVCSDCVPQLDVRTLTSMRAPVDSRPAGSGPSGALRVRRSMAWRRIPSDLPEVSGSAARRPGREGPLLWSMQPPPCSTHRGEWLCGPSASPDGPGAVDRGGYGGCGCVFQLVVDRGVDVPRDGRAGMP